MCLLESLGNVKDAPGIGTRRAINRRKRIAMPSTSNDTAANTCGTNIGRRAQQMHRAQFSGQESSIEPPVSSTQSSGTMLASMSVLWTMKAASHTARNSRTTDNNST